MTDHTKRARANSTGREGDEGRKASKPLYVMLTDEQKARYEKAAEAVGMNMREFVTAALDAFVAQQRVELADLPQLQENNEEGNVRMLHKELGGHRLRLKSLESFEEAIDLFFSNHEGRLESIEVGLEQVIRNVLALAEHLKVTITPKMTFKRPMHAKDVQKIIKKLDREKRSKKSED